jgi:hypothetical protein
MTYQHLFVIFLAATIHLLVSCTEPTTTSTKEGKLTTRHITLRTIEPSIGETPDISTDAKKNFERQKRLINTIDSAVQSYPDYETAKQHLTQRQIDIYENEEAFSKEDHLDVSTWGCSWYCAGGPESVIASSVLPSVNNLDYKADNAHDFSLRTAWVEGAPGLGIGQSISYRFAKGSPPVTTVEIYNGYMKSEKAWGENARVKQLKLYVNDSPFALLNVKDIQSKQLFAIDTLQGKDKDLMLKFEITAVYKGSKYEDVALSEIEFDGIGVHCFAKGTLVATPDGEVAIENLGIGNIVLSYNEISRKTEAAAITAVASQQHNNLYELNFSGTTMVVTDDHPFFYAGQYYSVKRNHLYGLQTQELHQGQLIAFLTKTGVSEKKLSSLKALTSSETAYTITRLSRNKLFFANGACVAVEEIKHH